MSDRDYYETLGLTPIADGAMVDQAYWHLARKYQTLAQTHPDAHHMLDELNEAYGVLGNPVLRREYDAFRDDVLVATGAIGAVPSKGKTRKRGAEEAADDRGGTDAGRLSFANWRWYGLSAIIAGLAFAGAWQGVNLVFVAAALAIGLALSLTPTLKRRVSELSLSMPTLPNVALPAVALPDVKAPKLTLPKLPEFAADEEDDVQLTPEELRESTAAIIQRWRKSMGLRAGAPSGDGGEPSKTLVEIVEGERDLEAEAEPIDAVMEILRGARKAPEGSGQTA